MFQNKQPRNSGAKNSLLGLSQKGKTTSNLILTLYTNCSIISP